MNQPLDPRVGRPQGAVENLGSRSIWEVHDGRLGDDRVTGWLRRRTSLDCDMVPWPPVSAQQRAAHGALQPWNGPSSRRPDANVDDPDVYAVGVRQHRDRVYGLVPPVWSQAKVLADTSPTPTRPPPPRFQTATKLKSWGEAA